MMTKEELLKKNAAIRAARELEAKKKAVELESKREESAPVEEVAIITEETEEKKEEQPKKKRGGRKPANREYMVVDNAGIEEEGSEDTDF